MKTTIRVVVALVILLIAIGVVWGVNVMFVKVPEQLARSTADGIRSVFNFTPRVSINQTIVIEQTTPILEVATVSRDLFIDHTWQHTWLGSTKTIQLRGVFTAKAGFDLREPFSINIERDPLRVEAMVPPPRLLSIEMKDYAIVRDESGWWNSVSAEDREDAVRDMRAEAIDQATHSGLLEESAMTVRDRIRDIVERNGASVIFRDTTRIE